MSKKFISSAELLEENNYQKSQQISQKKDQSSKILEKKSVLKGFILTIIFITCLVLAWHYTQNNYKNNNTSPSTVLKNQNSEEDEAAVIKSKSKRVRMLNPGFYVFKMEAGEETSWLKLPTNKSILYEIGSPDDNWIIEYSDGTILKGSENPTLPYKEKVVFKLKSLIKQKINVKITEM